MCTGIKVNYEDGCVMGRTMDLEVSVDYNAIYFPANYNFCNDLMGDPLDSKYKVLGMCFRNMDPIKDGVNEYGLIGATNDFAGFNLYDNKVKPGKLNISSLFYLTYALTHYKSIEELVNDLPNIHLSSKDYKGEDVVCPDFHYMFTDSTKRCIVIEPKGKKLIVYENPYDVMTNSPGFESQVRRLNRLMDINNLNDFNSAKDLPGGYDPVSRFIKAFYLTRMNANSKDSKEALSNCYNILGAIALPNGFLKKNMFNQVTYTKYTSAYDSKDKILTVKSDTNPMVYQLGFDDIEDENKRQSFFLDKAFTTEKINS